MVMTSKLKPYSFSICPYCKLSKRKRYDNETCRTCGTRINRWGDCNGKRITLAHIHYTITNHFYNYTPSKKLLAKIEYVYKYMMPSSEMIHLQGTNSRLPTKKAMLCLWFSLHRPSYVLAGKQLMLYLIYILTDDGYNKLRNTFALKRRVIATIKEHILPSLIEELPKLDRYINKYELKDVFSLHYDGKYNKLPDGYVNLEDAAKAKGIATKEKGGKWIRVRKLNEQRVWVEHLEWKEENEEDG